MDALCISLIYGLLSLCRINGGLSYFCELIILGCYTIFLTFHYIKKFYHEYMVSSYGVMARAEWMPRLGNKSISNGWVVLGEAWPQCWRPMWVAWLDSYMDTFWIAS